MVHMQDHDYDADNFAIDSREFLLMGMLSGINIGNRSTTHSLKDLLHYMKQSYLSTMLDRIADIKA